MTRLAVDAVVPCRSHAREGHLFAVIADVDEAEPSVFVRSCFLVRGSLKRDVIFDELPIRHRIEIEDAIFDTWQNR